MPLRARLRSCSLQPYLSQHRIRMPRGCSRTIFSASPGRSCSSIWVACAHCTRWLRISLAARLFPRSKCGRTIPPRLSGKARRSSGAIRKSSTCERLAEVRHRKQKHEAENRHAESDCCNRQQDLQRRLTAANSASPCIKRARSPLAERRDISVLFIRICMPAPCEPNDKRDADQDEKEQRNNRKRHSFVGAAAEQRPHGKH